MRERGEIVGSGDIASVLQEREGIVFFASGVSNSGELPESEYQREKDLLLQQDRSQRIVYFGSLSIFYSDTRYTQHKREMEELVKGNFDKYCIVRIGNIDFGDNPHTLINFLRNKYKSGEPLQIMDVERYVVGQDEFLHWIDLIPDNLNCEINVPGDRMKVKEIFKKYVI